LSPKATAKAAKLRYVSDRTRGIRRERSGNGFDFFGADGAKIH
jgi:DNA topoisomerase I